MGGMIPVSTARTALMTADRPLAASLWPMLVLTLIRIRTEISNFGRDSTRGQQCQSLTAPIKRGSLDSLVVVID